VDALQENQSGEAERTPTVSRGTFLIRCSGRGSPSPVHRHKVIDHPVLITSGESPEVYPVHKASLPPNSYALFPNRTMSASDIEDIISKLTLSEKIKLLTGLVRFNACLLVLNRC
jgi:hypothetical protein